MKRIVYSGTLAMLLLALLIAAAAAQGAGGQGGSIPAGRYQIGDPVTEIVVDSGEDLNTSKSETCSGEDVCTLRRAIVESRLLAPSELPVLISFDIPTSDPSYNSGLKVWELEILSTTDPSVFRQLRGQVIIDGSTQPGGRTTGPKIILVGPSTGNKDGLILGEVATHDANEIRSLAFQNFKTHMYINSSENFIADNWFGLTANGLQVYLRNDEPEDGSGSTAIAFTSGVADTTVRDNVFAGFDGVSIALRGDDNQVLSNYIGTRWDGKVPKVTDPDLVCTTVDWLGGGGISVDGSGHRIKNNVIAGLRQEVFVLSTQPDAVRASGDDHVIMGNDIGVDATGANVGVCGRGIYLAGADASEFNLISGNTIVNPGLSAISINGEGVDGNTMEDNIVRQANQWPQVEGNSEPEDAIQFGTTVPDSLREFKPAKVISINGVSVTGDDGPGSPCPNCIVELYLDDGDAVTETLKLLATTTAGPGGGWSVTISDPLVGNQSIRTTSTSATFNTIAGLSAGTTTKLSVLYKPSGGGGGGSEYIFLPLMGK